MFNPFEAMDVRMSKLENILSRIEQKIESSSNTSKELLSPDEAAELLGITKTTLWRHEKDGKVKVYGLGAKRYLKMSELMESLTQKITP